MQECDLGFHYLFLHLFIEIVVLCASFVSFNSKMISDLVASCAQSRRSFSITDLHRGLQYFAPVSVQIDYFASPYRLCGGVGPLYRTVTVLQTHQGLPPVKNAVYKLLLLGAESRVPMLKESFFTLLAHPGSIHVGNTILGRHSADANTAVFIRLISSRFIPGAFR